MMQYRGSGACHIRAMRSTFRSGRQVASSILGAAMLFVPFVGATVTEVTTPDPPGKLVDIGGYRLHIWRMGEEGDSPAVALIPPRPPIPLRPVDTP